MKTHQNNRIVFAIAGLLHLDWGVGLLLYPIQNVTAIANAAGGMSSIPAAVLMIAVGVAAVSSTFTRNRYVALGLIVSQQIVLILSAWAAIECAKAGHYADGTPAEPSHIFHDQFVYVLLAVGHTAAIVQTHGEELWTWLVS